MKRKRFDFTMEPGKYRERNFCNVPLKEKPLISIVTPYYNAKDFFEQTFNSVINQTLANFEWIIVDDGSNKENKDFLQGMVKKDYRIRLFIQENQGQSKARNKGIKEALADIVVPLDADDLIENYFLEINYHALKHYPEADWSYTDSVGFYNQDYTWCIPFSAGRLTIANFLVVTAAFRKKTLNLVGGYSELEKHYDEDWELFLKLLVHKMVPLHIPVLGFWYRRRSDGMKQKVRLQKYLRKQSEKHIQSIAKQVDIKLQAQEYKGRLPVKSKKGEVRLKDNILRWLFQYRFMILLVRKIKKRDM